jgi:hypothetical protein
LLKHYPVRSQKHGERKIFRERRARWNPEEKAKGWHDHYDAIKEDHAFVLSSSGLQVFDEADFNKTYLVERLSGIGVIRDTRRAAHNLRVTVRELAWRLAQKEAQLESAQELSTNLMLAQQEAQLETAQELTLRLAQEEAQLKTVRQFTLKLAEKDAQLEIARQLAPRLMEKEAQLEQLSNSLGWRLLSHFGPIKYRFVLPAYKTIQKLFGGKLPQGSDSK